MEGLEGPGRTSKDLGGPPMDLGGPLMDLGGPPMDLLGPPMDLGGPLTQLQETQVSLKWGQEGLGGIQEGLRESWDVLAIERGSESHRQRGFSPFLGRGPIGDDDLWYHHMEFFPFSSFSSFLFQFRPPSCL